MKKYNDEELDKANLQDYRSFLVQCLNGNENFIKNNFLYTMVPFILFMMLIQANGNDFGSINLSTVAISFFVVFFIIFVFAKIRSYRLKKQIRDINWILEDDDFDF